MDSKEQALLPCPFCGDDGDKGRQHVTQMTADRPTFDRIICRSCGAMVSEANWNRRAQPRQPKIDVEHLIRTVLPGGNSVDPQAVADDLRRYFDAWEEPKAIAWKTPHKAVCVPFTEDAAVAENWRVAGFPVVELFDKPQQPAGWKPIETAPRDQPVMVYTPPQPGDYPEDVRIGFDARAPESDGDYWLNHSEHYEHFMAVGGTRAAGPDEACTGPSEQAPYTHWMPIPAIPTAHPSQQEDMSAYKRMFEAAIRDLAAISEHLGLDPDEDGGADPIIYAIDELRATQQEDDARDGARLDWLEARTRDSGYATSFKREADIVDGRRGGPDWTVVGVGVGSGPWAQSHRGYGVRAAIDAAMSAAQGDAAQGGGNG